MLRIEKNKNLVSFNSLAFESVAELFTVIDSEDELSQAIDYADEHKLVRQFISGGSNLLMAEFVPGITVHIQIKGIKTIAETESDVVLRVAAGENWHGLVKYSVENNWQGIENLALIPGLVGAAPIQNIGAYGTEIKDVIVKVRAYDVRLGKFITLDNKHCCFGYRDSIFKRQNGRYIVSSIDIKLTKKVNIEYKYQAIKHHFLHKKIHDVNLYDMFEAVCAIRSEKLPSPDVIANAGSFFKNPVISREHFEKQHIIAPNIVGYSASENTVKVAAGWLIEDCGWKGYSENGVGVYAKQALVLIHSGESTLTQLLALADKIKVSVYDRFEITLEIEPQHFPLSKN